MYNSFTPLPLLNNISNISTVFRDPSFDPKVHNIVSLTEVLGQNPGALQQIKQEFKTRGWCIIKLPNAPVKARQEDERNAYMMMKSIERFHSFPIHAQTAGSTLASFFAQPDYSKGLFKVYSAVPHKESIHITTPSWKDFDSPFPSELNKWCSLWDEVSVELMQAMAESVFGCSHATLAHRADLPIAWSGHSGMLDVAHYLNKQTVTLSHDIGFSTQDVNCVPHYDPGLLSISFLSTHEGLQLKDPTTGTWFAGPVNTVAGQEDLGVIWLGEAAVRASKGELREGVHRVVYPQTPVSRISAWYELCTTDQVNQEVKNTLPTKGKVKLHNLPGSKRIILNGDRGLIERHYGIPMSKSGAPLKNQHFRAKYSEDLSEQRGTGWGQDTVMGDAF